MHEASLRKRLVQYGLISKGLLPMALDAVQKNQTPPSSVSYIKAASIGALSGYALKYILPITYQERDENYNEALNKNQLEAETQKAAAIEEIRKSKRSELTDTFIRMNDTDALTQENINKLKSPLRDGLLDIVKKLDGNYKESLAVGKKNLDAVTKSIRPTAIFVGVGLVVGFLSAVVRNILRRIDYYNAQYIDETVSA